MSDTNNAPKITNRPGLSALTYRVGDYASFRSRLLSHLSQDLPGLKTRDPDDAAIALLDAWAVVADVLTFYQERIANEGYLNTATERQSIIELGRLIGYELKPGVAASTYLAFTLENKPAGSATSVLIPRGTQAMSIPAEGEAPQTFETSADFQAHPDWNNLQPRLSKPQEITNQTRQLYLTGINTGLTASDWVLLMGTENQQPRQFLLWLSGVEAIAESSKTRITWDTPLDDLVDKAILHNPQLFAFRQRAGLFGNLAPRWKNVSDEMKRQADGVVLKGGVFQADISTPDQGLTWTANSTGLPNQDILCLAAKGNYLFAGTDGAGIFRLLHQQDPGTDSPNTWKAMTSGLTNLKIETLYVDEAQKTIFAGTPGGGVFRSKDDGENWVLIGTGNVRVEGVETQVKAINTGLPNVVVRSLLAYDVGSINYIFAGTDESIYRTTSQGQDWSSEKIPNNSTSYQNYQHLQGLPNQVVYDLLRLSGSPEVFTGRITSIELDKQTVTVESIPGTEPIPRTLRPGDVIAISGQTKLVEEVTAATVTLKQDFASSVLPGTDFTSSAIIGKIDRVDNKEIYVLEVKGILQRGDRITAAGQTRTISEVINQTISAILELDEAFQPDVPPETDFTSSTVTGKINSSNAKTAQITQVSNILQRGDRITALGQTKTIDGISYITTAIIKLEEAFQSSVLPGSNFSTSSNAGGRIRQIIGQTIDLTSLSGVIKVGDTITAAGQTQEISQLVSCTFRLDQPFHSDVNLIVGKIFECSYVKIFAGTDRGIYYSNNHGMGWNPITIPSTVKSVFSLASYKLSGNSYLLAGTNDGIWHSLIQEPFTWQRVDQDGILSAKSVMSLQVVQSGGTNYIFAVTKQGVFRSSNLDWNWIEANQGLTTTDIISIATAPDNPAGGNPKVFAGARFSGFAEARLQSREKHYIELQEWPKFQLDAKVIDLDGLYPKILPNSWITLLDLSSTDQQPAQPLPLYAIARVASVATASRQDFGLDLKVTHIIPAPVIDHPEKFGRRTAIVLAQSESLALAEESLTVSAQKEKVFQDSLWDNKIFLRQYVQGLEPKQPLIVSGKYIRARVNAGGIFRSRNWQRRSGDSFQQDIKTVAIRDIDGVLFAATETEIFQSNDGGKSWQSISKGLNEAHIRTIAVYTKPLEGWMNTRLQNEPSESIIQTPPRQSGLPPIFAPELQSGDTIIAEGQTRIFQRRASATELVIDTPFGEKVKYQTFGKSNSNKLLVGTDQGIFRYRADTEQWEKVTPGLAFDVQILAIGPNKDYVLAGTKSDGIFRSTDGETWEPTQLIKANVQTVVINPANGHIFAGTQENGVLRSTDSGDTWKRVSRGLSSPNITVLAIFIPYQGTGTISSQDKTVTGTGTAFKAKLQQGDFILSANQVKIIDNLNSNTQLSITQPFSSNLPDGTPFFILHKGQGSISSAENQPISGTGTAFNKELNEGDSIVVQIGTAAQIRLVTAFQLIVSKDIRISQPSFFSIPRRGTGMVYAETDKTKVKGQETQFLRELRKGDLIIIGDEIRVIDQINSDNELIVQTVFQTALQTTIPQPFFIPYRGTGIVYADVDNKKVRGEATQFLREFEKDDLIIVDGEIRIVDQVISDEELTIASAFSSAKLPQDPSNSQSFFRVDRGTGTISQSGTTGSGKDAIFNAELNVKDILIAHKVDGIDHPVIETVNEFQLTIDRDFDRTLSNSSFAILSSAYLFAATAKGEVFRSIDNGNTWKPATSNLKDVSIRSLVVDPNHGYVFAGTTEKGVFRSTYDGNSWDPINTGLTNQAVRSLTLQPGIESTGIFVAGTQAGVFHSTADGTGLFQSTDPGQSTNPNKTIQLYWGHDSQCLTDTHVLALTAYRLGTEFYLFAGTKSGVFRSVDHGQTWEAMSQGLKKNIPVQTLLAIDSGSQLVPGFKVFAGTQEGLFYSADAGKSWQTVNLGFAHPDVRDLKTHAFQNSVEKQSQTYLFAATLERGIFRSADLGVNWRPIGLTKQKVRVRVLLSAKAYLFAGTDGNGIFFSQDNGNSWQQLTDSRPGTGTISSEGIVVSGSGTAFSSELKVGDTLDANGQTGTVIAIASDTSLTVDAAFKPALTAETFTIPTGLSNLYITSLAICEALTGTISAASNSKTITGDENTKFTQELKAGDTIEIEIANVTGDNNKTTVERIISDQKLEVTKAFGQAIPAGTRFKLKYPTLFAGTAGSGVFRAYNDWQRWEAVNQGFNLTDLEIRCLTLDLHNTLLVGTATSGVLQLANNGNTWEPLGVRLTPTEIRTELTNIDVRAILIDQINLYVGGIGILQSPEQLNYVELQRDDLLRVVTAPTPLTQANGGSAETETIAAQQWTVLNRDNFQGRLILTSLDDIQLEPAAEEDSIVSELCTLQAPPDDEDRPILTLAAPLTKSYDPASITVYANVAEVTHGETNSEILGSGNGALPNQRFTLSKPPLTYTADASSKGGQSTLKVYVNDVEWTEVPSLYPLDKQAQSYTIQIEDDGTTTITFGDGQRGARLPSGRENITAIYRSGIGLAGRVGAGQIALKKTGPPSLLTVINPLPATGAAPRETLDSARNTIPATTRTLDRIVSLQDFEDFSQAFAGVGKAQAIALWNGETELVHITITANEGKTVDLDSDLYRSLVKAINQARDPMQQVQVDSFEPLFFKLEARFAILPRYQVDKVKPKIRERLLKEFAFERREFGQAVTASEVIATIQSVEGVQAVDLDALHRRDASRTLQQTLSVTRANWNDQKQQVQAAQLLRLVSSDMILTSVPAL